MSILTSRRGGVGKSLPYDAEVEYIQSNGRQYIDCEVGMVYSTDTVDLITTVAFTSNSPRQLNGTNGYYFFGVSANKNFEFSGTEFTYNSNFNTWNIHFEPNQKVRLTINGANYESLSTPSDNPYLFAIFLFALGGRDNASAQLFASQKQAAAQIVKNGVLVRDYIPVRVGSVGYLYDKVTKQMFADKNGIGFAVGQDK